MTLKKLYGAAGKILAVTTMTLIISLMFVQGAGACRYKTLFAFTGWNDGNEPLGSLIFDQSGALYGTAYGGGDYGHGVIFKLTPNGDGTWTQSVLHSFDFPDGDKPSAALIFDASGKLYGTTLIGGWDEGGVFQFTPNLDGSWSETMWYDHPANGYNPSSSLTLDAAGNLYGTTKVGMWWYPGGDCAYPGCGGVFELIRNPDGSWSDKGLLAFGGGEDGKWPVANLIFDAAGNLYSTASAGGTYGQGLVFELMPNPDGTWTKKVLHSFHGKDGSAPSAGLIFDEKGNLYGTTPKGGAYGGGTVFKLTLGSDGIWRAQVLHSFAADGADGVAPYSSLVRDQKGNFYGTTSGGGTEGYGTVFKLKHKKGGWTETVVHSFKNFPGADPYAGLTLDAAGNLYGTTSGSDWGDCRYHNGPCGSVFEITP